MTVDLFHPTHSASLSGSRCGQCLTRRWARAPRAQVYQSQMDKEHQQWMENNRDIGKNHSLPYKTNDDTRHSSIFFSVFSAKKLKIAEYCSDATTSSVHRSLPLFPSLPLPPGDFPLSTTRSLPRACCLTDAVDFFGACWQTRPACPVLARWRPKIAGQTPQIVRVVVVVGFVHTVCSLVCLWHAFVLSIYPVTNFMCSIVV